MWSSIIRPLVLFFLLLSIVNFPVNSQARDLPQILEAGVLRHLGIPYANFITGSGDGLDAELMQGFANYIGVRYQFVETSWSEVFGDLTGRHARRGEHGAELLGKTPVKGDVIANGMTVLSWREDVVNFSKPTFPSSVWLIARAESTLQPITPSGFIENDIFRVKSMLGGHSVLALKNTCLDPALYHMSETNAEVHLPKTSLKLNEMAPAILNKEAEATLLDVPDALIALEKWPGQLKVVGPISTNQVMGAAFRKDSPQLQEEFNRYLTMIWKSGVYKKMVEKYYPAVFFYYADFFEN